MKKYFYLIAGWLLLAASCRSQRILRLDHVLTAIEKNNPQPKVYDARIRSLDEASRGANSWAPPEVGAGFFMTPYDLSMTKAPPSGKGMGAFAVSATQMFPNSREQKANTSYLRSLSEVDREQRQYALNDLYARAKSDYYERVVIQKKMALLNDDGKLLHFMIQSAELRYKNNLGKLDAYYKTQAALGKIESQRAMLEGLDSKDQIDLNTLMNRNEADSFSVDTNYVIKNYPDIDSSDLIQARSDIKELEQNSRIANLELNLEKAKQLPQFGITYDHMFAFGQAPWLFSLMVTVKIPLTPWSAGSYRARTDALQWQQESYSRQRTAVINEAEGNARDLLASIAYKKRQLRLFEETIIPALQRNYKVMQLSYEQNTGELFELFDAWESLFVTQLEELDQLQELLDLQVQMDKTLEIK